MKATTEPNDFISEMVALKYLIKNESSSGKVTGCFFLATFTSMGLGFLVNPGYLMLTFVLARTTQLTRLLETDYCRTYPLSSLSEETQGKITPLLEMKEFNGMSLNSSIADFLAKLSSLINSKSHETYENKKEQEALKRLGSQLEKLGFLSNNQQLMNQLASKQSHEFQVAFNIH